MIVEENQSLRNQVLDNVRGTIVQERMGIHLSDLIYCTRKAYWRKKGESPPPTDSQCLLYTTGYAFQSWLFPQEGENSILVDGINCTPDITSGIEVKSTRQSMKNFDPQELGSSGQSHWRKQILGYCKALDILEYDLVVLFLMGDYKPPFPELGCWHLTTTIEEVRNNWEEILKKRDALQIALARDVPPEPDNTPWEARYCECVDLCSDTPCYKRRHV